MYPPGLLNPHAEQPFAVYVPRARPVELKGETQLAVQASLPSSEKRMPASMNRPPFLFSVFSISTTA